MPVRGLLLSCWAVLFLVGSATASPPEPATWRAGAATVTITPDVPMWMAGYASRDKPAAGKLHDLKAKALALAAPAGQRAVIVTIDLVGIDREVSKTVCQEIARQYDLPRETVLLNASHTHSGPVAGNTLRPTYALDDQNRRLVQEYTKRLEQRLVEVVGQALNQLAPADLAWGNGQVTFAVNRRENKEPDVPQLRSLGRLKGPVDHDVPVLSVRDKEGKLVAVLFGYACHATVLSDYEWSGDYPGFAQIALEKAHPGATALFFAGCGADQNPLPRRSIALAESYGQQLADGVDAVLNAPMNPMVGDLRLAYTEVPLAFTAVPDREQLVETAAGPNRFETARAKLLLERLDAGNDLTAPYPYPVQAWQLGDLTLVALGGEVVVDYGRQLKQLLGRDSTWVAGYSNDVMAYIPTRRVLGEGGYEGGGSMVYFGLPSAWAPEIEDQILSSASSLVKQNRLATTSEPTEHDPALSR